jgi:hypothetical protein
MTEKVINGSDVKYALVYIDEEDIQRIKECSKKHHEIVGYGVVNEDDVYIFYSVEDNYARSISNHWTEDIVHDYDTHTHWILLKTHPCNIYSIMMDVFKCSNFVCDVNNFDVWRTEAKDCLIGVVTDMEID